MSGVLVVFSGLDGAGKSTQIELLNRCLTINGKTQVTIWTRGGYTPLFERLKSVLRGGGAGRIIPPSGPNPEREEALRSSWKRRVWLILAILELGWIYAVMVRWHLWRGRVVICDRYSWDTRIDFLLNFPQEQVQRWAAWRLLERFSANPDIAYLMLIPVEESQQRSVEKDEPFPSSRAQLEQRFKQYQQLASAGWFHIVDGRLPAQEIGAAVYREVINRIR